MTNRLLGCYWCPTHGRQGDKDYIQALQPPAIRLLDPDVQQISDAHYLAPLSLILPRDHPLSEQHEDMARDPKGTGQRHATDWRLKVDTWRQQANERGLLFPSDHQMVVVGINEPHVWEVGMVDATVSYTVSFLENCANLNLRACALNLGVGWPANSGEGTKPDWRPYSAVEEAIEDGGHFACVHEYWYWTGPQDGWGWYAGRILSCPWDVPIIIGETGVDCYCDNNRWQQDGGNRGWQGHMPSEEYAAQLHTYLSGLDDRIFAILPFLTDYRDNQWASFDTEPAHGDILSFDWALDLPQFGGGTESTPPDGGGAEPPVDVAAIWHPLPTGVISQHWGQGGDNYAQYGMWGHNGTDLAADLGTPILCIADGVVAWADWDDSYGWYCRIFHESLGVCSFYAHQDLLAVAQGQTIAGGEVVGYVGSSGNSTGAHLHLEIRAMNPDGSYNPYTPMRKGRIDPESWCSLYKVML